ncbi:MAG: dUTP diphosphatase [Dialister sp.]|uniref:dUTP diphosphatase n=1 Tax=Dialister sp. TaxID=1955814 RepID=UPI00257F381F|nr:dUTP diphosphatase [Dialister sp.]MBS6295931.1 dUTP diphosphatase [Dialister sp.]
MKIKIKTEKHIPEYKTKGAVGMDVKALLPSGSCIIFPGQIKLIPTGISLEIPKGYEVQMRARSGLSTKYGIGIVNGVGTIDNDYRGKIGVPLINWGTEPFTINDGDRIAQLVVARYERAEFEEVDELSGTKRGNGGFGSTGR